MKKNTNFNENKFCYILFTLILGYLIFRNYGIYPSVVDEYTHSTNARSSILNLASAPDYLFRVVYRSVNLCHDGWLGCAKFLNIIFFGLGIFFVYKVASKYISIRLSIWVALLSILSPINTYTAYFMPENLYFLVFWIFIWSIVEAENLGKFGSIFISGLMLGLLSLVKPHAIFLLPGVLFFIVTKRFCAGERLWSGVKESLIFLVIFFVVKFSISFYFDRDNWLTLFGVTYTGVARDSILNIANISLTINMILKLFYGHIFSIILFSGVSLILLGDLNLLVNRENEYKNRIKILSLVLILSMIIVVVGFTATGGGITNDISQTLRIHSRYYNYMLPLLFIILAQYAEGGNSYLNKPKLKYILVFIALVFSIYALFTLFKPFTPNYVDGPEISGLIKNNKIFIAFCIINIVLLTLYIFKDKLAIKLILIIYLPFSVLISNVHSARDLNNRLYMSPFDRAAIAVKNMLRREDVSKLIIIGPAPALGILVLSQIHFDNSGVSAGVFDEKIPLKVNDFNKKIEWVLSIGEYSYIENPITSIRGDGFLLSRIRANNEIDFRNQSLPLNVSSISGLGPPSHAGRWSVGKLVSINYVDPLPSDFNLKIKVSPHIENINKPIEIKVGNVTRKLVLTGEMEESIINFSGVRQGNSLRIKIANPLIESEGSIGVMITKIEIDPIQSKKK